MAEIGNINVRIYFTVLLADNLVNPDGSTHTDTRADMYSKIPAYLAQTSGLIVTTEIGVFSSIGALGHSATEVHYGPLSIVSAQLNNIGAYFPPADPVILSSSVWDGVYTWDTSYWR